MVEELKRIAKDANNKDFINKSQLYADDESGLDLGDPE